MRSYGFVLLSLCAASASIAQEVRAVGSFLEPAPYPGVFRDEPESDFFRILRTRHVQEAPFTLKETVDMSTVIAKGYFVDVMPGRTITNTRRESMPPIQTVLLKIQTTWVVQGDYRSAFYLEYPMHWSNLDRLNETLYRNEILFLLGPPIEFYGSYSTATLTSAEAAIELGDEQIYGLVLQSGLFTMSKSGGLTSAIDVSQDYGDIYERIQSLDELTSHIVALSQSD
jgi:hypothetical protein